MSSQSPMQKQTQSSATQAEWHQPVIPGMEEFIAKLNQQPKTLPPSQSK